MMRSFAAVVAALAAFTSQAQEINGAVTAGGTSTSAAAPQESPAHPVMLASRAAPATPSGSARTLAQGDGGDAGTKPRNGAAAEPAQGSIVEAFRKGLPTALRLYEAPQATQTGSTYGWRQPPYVAAVAHFGSVYIFQVRSQSREAWVIRQARLEGPGGEVLQVDALQPGDLSGQRSVNVIVAKAPPGAKLSKLRLHMTGEDGRVAQAEAEDVP